MIVKHFTPLSYTVNNMNMVVHICEVAGILLSVLASALSKEPQILCALVDLQKICNICWGIYFTEYKKNYDRVKSAFNFLLNIWARRVKFCMEVIHQATYKLYVKYVYVNSCRCSGMKLRDSVEQI